MKILVIRFHLTTVKKKVITNLTVASASPQSAQKTTTTFEDRKISEHDSLESAVLKVVKNDPFASIGEIKYEINLASDLIDVSWWKIFSVLRRNNLLRGRSRFRYGRKFY